MPEAFLRFRGMRAATPTRRNHSRPGIIEVMGAHARPLTGLVLIVVLALAPVAGAVCDTLCAPAAAATHTPTCHEPASGSHRLDACNHMCPESHAVLQTSQALLTFPRGATDDLAPVSFDLVLRSPLALTDVRAGLSSKTLPLHPSPTLVSPILRI